MYNETPAIIKKYILYINKYIQLRCFYLRGKFQINE